MHLHGDFMHALTTALPHEVTHTVLASYFGPGRCRGWADEWISLLSEPEDEQATHDARARAILNQGRGWAAEGADAHDRVPEGRDGAIHTGALSRPLPGEPART